jgi:hypothetical protein
MLELLEDANSDIDTAILSDETIRTKLENVMGRLISDIQALVGHPIRLVWDGSTQTAATDCIKTVYFNPYFFLQIDPDNPGSEREQYFDRIGFGIAYHESGHIVFSPWGGSVMSKASDPSKGGSEFKRSIANIILDRKDDMLVADFAPGFANVLRSRLSFLMTASRRELVRFKNPTATEAEISHLLKGWRPQDKYEDFFFAAKWGKRPRFAETRKAMKVIRRRPLRLADAQTLELMTKKVVEILGEPEVIKQSEAMEFLESLTEGEFENTNSSSSLLPGLEGSSMKARVDKIINQVLASIVETGTENQLMQLERKLQNMPPPIPRRVSVGLHNYVPLETVRSTTFNSRHYDRFLEDVKHHLAGVEKAFRRLESPEEIWLGGRDDGELDLHQVARIATGLGGYYREIVTDRNVDAELHFAIDTSGSMLGDPLIEAKRMAVLFSEVVRLMHPEIIGNVWAYNSEAVYDFGEPSIDSGFLSMSCTGGNSDTHLLKYASEKLSKSKKHRKVLIVLCDDGPDDIDKARSMSYEMLARGIVVVHIMINVHGVPDIYPFELIYSNLDKAISEFGDLLYSIVSNIK